MTMSFQSPTEHSCTVHSVTWTCCVFHILFASVSSPLGTKQKPVNLDLCPRHLCFVTWLLAVETNQSFFRSYFLTMSNIRDNLRFPRAIGRTSKATFCGLRVLTTTVSIDILLSQFSSIKSICRLIFLNPDSNLIGKNMEKLFQDCLTDLPLCVQLRSHPALAQVPQWFCRDVRLFLECLQVRSLFSPHP